MKPNIFFIESNTTGTGALFFSRAVALGLEPILVSDDPARYRILQVYRSLKIEERSVAGIVAAIERFAANEAAGPVRGIWSSSDRAVETAARVANELGLPHANPDAIAICRDKAAARRVLTEAGVSGLPFAVAKTAEEACAFAASLDRPCVVKPCASTGSIGVRLCMTPQEVHCHAQALLESADAAAEGVLIEAFADGAEYSVEIFDGVSRGVTRKMLGPAPSFIEVGHDFPSPGPRDRIAALTRHAEQAVAALGLRRGPAHVELRLSNTGPVIIETNPRLAGGMIPELVRWATGIDLIDTTIRFACGLPYAFHAPRAEGASIRFVCRSTSAPVAALAGVSRAREIDGVVDVGVFPEAFGRSGPITDFRDRLGYVAARAETPDAAARIADQAADLLLCTPAAQPMDIHHA